MTVNVATTAGKILTILVIVVIAALPFMGVWCIAEEFTPVRIEVTADEIVVNHLKEEYAIALDDIEEIQLINELPRVRKDIGSNFDTLYKGQFQVEGYGTCHLCLNPQDDQFLVIRAGGKTYIFSPVGSIAATLQRAGKMD